MFAGREHLILIAVFLVTCGFWGVTSENYMQDLYYLILASVAYLVGFANSRKGKTSAKDAKAPKEVDPPKRKPKSQAQDDEGAGVEGPAEGEGERKQWYAPKAFRYPNAAYDSEERREMHKRILQKARQDGITPVISSYQELVQACAVLESTEMSVKVFLSMVETKAIQKMYPDWVHKGLAKNFFKLVSENLDDNSMRAHGLELLKLMQACGLEPTKLFQNLVIVGWKSKPPEYVLDFFLQMREWGVLLSSTAYRCIMIASERSDPARAMMLFEEMHERGVKIDAATFNAAMCACCQLGRPLDALRVSEQMPAANAVPNGKTYGILIDACTSAMKNREAQQLFDAMLQDGFQPNRFAYDDVIWCCIREEGVDKAIALYRQMLDVGLIPCKNTRENLIKICKRKGRMPEIQDLVGSSWPLSGSGPQE